MALCLVVAAIRWKTLERSLSAALPLLGDTHVKVVHMIPPTLLHDRENAQDAVEVSLVLDNKAIGM